MGYVALTAALFAAGAYLGRGMSYGLGIVWFIAAFVCLIAMNFAVRSLQLTVILLGGFGVLIGLAMAPMLAYYAGTNPRRCGRQAARPRCSSPDSAPLATRPGATCRRSRGSASSR